MQLAGSTSAVRYSTVQVLVCACVCGRGSRSFSTSRQLEAVATTNIVLRGVPAGSIKGIEGLRVVIYWYWYFVLVLVLVQVLGVPVLALVAQGC